MMENFSFSPGAARGLVIFPVCCALLSGLIGDCAAQTYPAKVVRIVVPVAAGGPTDILARAVAQKLTEAWNQQVVVETRPGGGSNIGFEIVAKSAPDGYTLLMAQPAFTVNVSLYKSLAYDPVRDFVPISLATTHPLLLLAHPTVPVRTVKELVALAKARPGQLNIGSAGNGTTPHLAAAWFNTVAGVRITHVPYKGASLAVIDLMGGHIDLLFASPTAVISHVQQHQLRPIAMTTPTRYHLLPDLPTFVESGYPEFVVMGWYGLLAPAGTPREIVSRVNADTVKALAASDMKERLNALGEDPVGSTPEQFSAWIKDEVTRWAKVVKAAGAKVD
jgi:tripartite-type tricarboxylate transporter receptor subunit TctC